MPHAPPVFFVSVTDPCKLTANKGDQPPAFSCRWLIQEGEGKCEHFHIMQLRCQPTRDDKREEGRLGVQSEAPISSKGDKTVTWIGIDSTISDDKST